MYVLAALAGTKGQGVPFKVEIAVSRIVFAQRGLDRSGDLWLEAVHRSGTVFIFFASVTITVTSVSVERARTS